MIKKVFTPAVLVGLLSASASFASWEGWTTPNGLNFRAGYPGSWNYNNVIATLPYCAKVTVLKCSPYNGANWCNVTWKGQNGWVSGKYLSRDNSHCVQQKPNSVPKKKTSTY